MQKVIAFVAVLGALWTAERPAVAQTAAAGVPSAKSTLDAYRKYALTHEGDVARGVSLFVDDQKLACSKCHSVDGSVASSRR